MAAHGVTKLSSTSVTDPKVIAAGEACLRYLTPAELQLLLGNGGGEEASQLGLYSWTDPDLPAAQGERLLGLLRAKRLDPATDGRPDPRPDVREDAKILGNLLSDFDFNQPPRPGVLLPTHPQPGPASSP